MEYNSIDSIHERIQSIISSLPVILEDSIPHDDNCPICLVSFRSILGEERCPDLSQEPPLCGVTKLAECGHLFCRKDLVEWIRSFHGNCPTCRHTFLDIRPPSESDEESSDGGEYVPRDEEDEEEDEFDHDLGPYTDDEMEDDEDDISDLESPVEGFPDLSKWDDDDDDGETESRWSDQLDDVLDQLDNILEEGSSGNRNNGDSTFQGDREDAE